MPNESFDFVLSSQVRLKVLSYLWNESSTPTQLASKAQKHLSHISRALKELEARELVACSNPDYYKQKKYSLTKQGTDVVNEIRKYQIRMSLL
jgi:predicted transcriptional regulator